MDDQQARDQMLISAWDRLMRDPTSGPGEVAAAGSKLADALRARPWNMCKHVYTGFGGRLWDVRLTCTNPDCVYYEVAK